LLPSDVGLNQSLFNTTQLCLLQLAALITESSQTVINSFGTGNFDNEWISPPDAFVNYKPEPQVMSLTKFLTQILGGADSHGCCKDNKRQEVDETTFQSFPALSQSKGLVANQLPVYITTAGTVVHSRTGSG
jgi:hypothetical protein